MERDEPWRRDAENLSLDALDVCFEEFGAGCRVRGDEKVVRTVDYYRAPARNVGHELFGNVNDGTRRQLASDESYRDLYLRKRAKGWCEGRGRVPVTKVRRCCRTTEGADGLRQTKECSRTAVEIDNYGGGLRVSGF